MTRIGSILSRSRLLAVLALLTLLIVGTYWGRFVVMIGGRYVPEPFLMLALGGWVLIDSRHCIATLRSFFLQRFTLIVMLVLLYSAMSGLVLGQSPIDAYTQVRSIMAFLLAFHIARRSSPDIAPIALIVVLACYVAYFPLSDNLSEKYRFPVWASIVGVYLCFRQDRPVAFVVVIALSVVLGLWSNYRQDLAATILFPAFYAARMLTTSGRAFAALSVAIILVVLNADFLLSAATDQLFGRGYGQIIIKSTWLLDSVSSGRVYDSSLATRLEYLDFIRKNWIYLLIPLGLGDTQTVGSVLGMFKDFNTVDSGLAFIGIHFGFIPGSIILYFLMRGIVQSFDTALLAIAFLLYLLVSAQLLTVFELAVVSGLALGAAAALDRRSNANFRQVANPGEPHPIPSTDFKSS